MYFLVYQSYIVFRVVLIRRIAEFDTSRIQQLLSSAQLGDKKPSQLLRHMERLVGAKTIDPSLLRQLFLQRLPTNIVMVLEATADSVNLSTQAEIADRLMALQDNCPRPVSQITSTTMPQAREPDMKTPQQEIASLRADIAALTRTINKQLTSSSGRHSRRNSSHRSRTSSPDRSGLCFYHHHFGDQHQ